MTILSVEKAGSRLDELLNEVAKGGEVVITRSDGSSFKLVSYQKVRKPTFGSAKGQLRMSDDFDEPLSEFTDYMP